MILLVNYLLASEHEYSRNHSEVIAGRGLGFCYVLMDFCIDMRNMGSIDKSVKRITAASKE